ncbi:MAG: hypothetical protein WA960_15610 [Tunicatimonas sp.]
MKVRLLILLLALLGYSCASYYRTNQKFNRYFEEGELERADKVLEGTPKAAEGKARLLYYLNRGVTTALLGQPEESNRLLERAYELGEDLRNNYWNVVGSYLINPTFSNYTGEDHELLLIHYYKALNYLQLSDTKAALVECRRLNIKLNQFADKYPAGKGQKYRRDAFVHTLMGLIYDADGDANNAFIAYRNAVEIYEEDYQPLFGLGAPQQLKEDLLRTAHQMKFTDQLRRYEQQFGMTYQPQSQTGGDLVFFWNNGLGPVKAEWGVNFALVRGAGGLVNFQNQQYGWSFPFRLNSDEEYEEKGLSNLELIRVAFPRYQERALYFDQASLKASGRTYSLQKAEDVNAIAFQGLQQRMLREFSTSLLRVALKKGTEYGLRAKNDDLGAVLGVVNALTERADTRNWQTIPHTIYYRRVPLPAGDQTVQLALQGGNRTQNHEFTVAIRKNRTTFHSFQSLETTGFPSVRGGYSAVP